MKTIFDINVSRDDLQNKNYTFQPQLTEYLDNLDCDFDQSIVNQIVLWKVNRYSPFDEETFKFLNKISTKEQNLDEGLTREILKSLLDKKGVQLAMASTILRFKNPNIYQIIDQRVYRFIYGQNLPSYFSKSIDQIDIYIQYLKKLKTICDEKNINFQMSDRIIYELDKKHNKDLNIKY